MQRTNRVRRYAYLLPLLIITITLGLITLGTAGAQAQSPTRLSPAAGPPDPLGVPHHYGDTYGMPQLVHPLTANPDCTLRVPKHPLTAKGLATPYVLGSAGMACTETNEGTAAFVQATILDPATGNVFAYEPAVRDAGQPLLGTPPPVPVLPPGAIVTIWTGFNGNVLKLTGPGHKAFVNFAQQAYANSPKFFAAADTAIGAGLLTPAALGTANDGMACPSVRDFSVVDQDQSDNTTNVYPAYGVSNGSDDALLQHIDQALGCAPWAVPDLSNGGMTATGTLEELQAKYGQAAPQALVPSADPFVLNPLNGQPSVFLQNLYRAQLSQGTSAGNDTAAYCANLASVGEPRLKADAATEAGFPAPQFAPIGTNLANVLAFRFFLTWGNLGCQGLTGNPSPIQVTLDQNGIATAATYA